MHLTIILGFLPPLCPCCPTRFLAWAAPPGGKIREGPSNADGRLINKVEEVQHWGLALRITNVPYGTVG